MKNFFNCSSFRTSASRYGISLILCTMLFSSCDKDDAPSQESLLPPATVTGANIFGALLDGEPFIPRDGQSTINSDNKGLILRSSRINSI